MLAVAVLVMAMGACTSGAPVAPPAAAARAADGGQLFPLVRDVPASGGTTVRRVGFVDRSGRLVVRPTYRAALLCPAADGGDVVLAWGDGQLDVLGTDGETTGSMTSPAADAETSTQITTVTCGPLPGYATVGTDQARSVVVLPDLATSDLPPGVAVDASVLWVPATGTDVTAPYLLDVTTGARTTLPSDAVSLVSPDEQLGLATGEWPLPVLDAKGKRRYLDQTGSWVSTLTFARAGGFVDGHTWVSTGTSWHFVDTALAKTGRDWTSIVPRFTTDGVHLVVAGYLVTSTAGGTSTGLVAVDLTVVVDPDAESAVCTTTGSGTTACVASAADGTARLVVLPEGTSTPLPGGFTTALSDRMVTDATGSQVHNLTTGQTFAVPAPYRAVAAWADAYVVARSDNGLLVVLDGTGEATGLGTITRQVVATGGTAYFWATAGDQQGYVDAAGAWLYDEPRYIALED